MKFPNMKKKYIILAGITFFLANGALLKSANATEDKRLECGKRVGQTLALCLFKLDDNRTFLDYVLQFKKIVTEYNNYFDASTVKAANKVLNDIEKYLKKTKRPKAIKIAKFLTNLKQSLPANVIKELDEAFEKLQLRLLRRNRPLGTLALLGPLSNRLRTQAA